MALRGPTLRASSPATPDGRGIRDPLVSNCLFPRLLVPRVALGLDDHRLSQARRWFSWEEHFFPTHKGFWSVCGRPVWEDLVQNPGQPGLSSLASLPGRRPSLSTMAPAHLDPPSTGLGSEGDTLKWFCHKVHQLPGRAARFWFFSSAKCSALHKPFLGRVSFERHCSGFFSSREAPDCQALRGLGWRAAGGACPLAQLGPCRRLLRRPAAA